MNTEGWMRTNSDGAFLTVSAGGAWTIASATALDKLVSSLRTGDADRIVFDLSDLERLDSAGAWLLFRCASQLRNDGITVDFIGVSRNHRPMLDLVSSQATEEVVPSDTRNGLVKFLERIGRGFVAAMMKGVELLNFVGLVTITMGRTILSPRRLRPKALVTQIEQTGLNALPIVGLLSFLIGVVLAYLMSDQLRQFGAEVFTVNLVGLSMLREVAVLITAIMIAGRSGSAFTAQIGTMKVNEEIDAMGTLGLDPIEVLVQPRVLALMITLPFLTFFADVMGILGGGVMTVVSLGLSPEQFVTALKKAVDLNDFLVGMVKAPVHAYIIAIVGCYEGLKVERTAESVGRQTTTSVVESIFLVIVATSLFSIFFSILGI
ncbi:MAG: ABC transporter permease [Rhodospirillaceae bacterium]|jgi:phospholipid/cholesterol/gamma-HCH transport system permease protein|uniref:ABC transporter permease n=1 Tax=unclassified Hwanghaeella TaxID=2605944 RepID=UPI000C5BAEC2|nr:ABC transporter permease [Rhodospirillales bacterium]MAX47434.1 ABC transporter permease [Rhodospirillaceae bacterium]|tara:strand:+ start:16675 stop:17805 length:1131 start_codon:yes stop_codon:yes gene_type:complete